MQTVITINLNGRAFQLEETGFTALDAYLKLAAERLSNDPDKAEIMTDLEQAVAEKCQRFLSPAKNVVTAEEIARIIEEMGPVTAPHADEKAQDGSAAGSAHAGKSDDKSGSAPKRLYKVREGAMLAGVCTGLAAYLNVDVVIVRLVFVGLTLLTQGPWIIVYIVLALVVPYANTAEERAAASGLPFNAHEIIERAKTVGKESLENGKAWQRKWQAKAKVWNDKRVEEKQKWHEAHAKDYGTGHHAKRAEARRVRNEARQWKASANDEYAAHIWAHSSAPLLGVMSVVLSVLWIIACIQLVTRGSVFGFVIPANIPLWVSILGLVILYNFVVWPIRAAKMVGYQHAVRNYEYDRYGWYGMFDGIMWLAALGIGGWIAYVNVPAFHGFVDRLPAALQQFVETLKQ